MKFRKGYGLPTTPPHIGDDEIFLDESTGTLYARDTSGAVVAVTLTALTGEIQNTGSFAGGPNSVAVGDAVGTGKVLGPAAPGSWLAGWLSADMKLEFPDPQDLSGVSAGDFVLMQAYNDGTAALLEVVSVDDAADEIQFGSDPFGYDPEFQIVVFISATEGKNSAVFGKYTAASADNALVIGESNQAKGDNSLIAGEDNRTETRNTIACGKHVVTRWNGTITQGAERFQHAGDSQIHRSVVKLKTTSATPQPLASTSSMLFVLPDDTVVMIRALVLARNEGADEQAAYELTAVGQRGTGVASAALVGAVAQTVLHEDDAAWNATIVANTTSGSIDIQVTGKAATNIRWLASVDIIEIATA